MRIIHNSPYRVAGILSNASAKELQKNKGKINAYSKVGKKISFDIDFPVLSDLNRTEEVIQRAFSKIEQNKDKVNFSLFWLLKTSPIDETAINYLIAGDREKAIEIWTKMTDGKEVSSKNYSAFNNLGTLYLLSQINNEIKRGILLKVKLLKSPFFEDFVHAVADETFIIDSQKQIEVFVDVILEEFKSKYPNNELFGLFEYCKTSTQKYLVDKLSEDPIHSIQLKIEKSKKKRKLDSSQAKNVGTKLFIDTKSELEFLQSIMGTSNLHFKNIADKLSIEILQCGIDYFQDQKDTIDPSKEALQLLKLADSIAVKSQTKARIKENIEGMKEWAETAPIKEDLAIITSKLGAFQEIQYSSISNARSLVSSCKSRLQNMKNILGSRDEFYLTISSAVIGNALGMIIEVVNEAQSGLEYNRAKLLKLPDIVSEAVSVIKSMALFDMDAQTRQRFNDNKSTIEGINSQLTTVRRQIQSAQSRQVSSSNSSDGGCYIATMAYGDYDHPQVLELRKFRDDFLSKTLLGRSFIKFYYKYSPRLVEKLKHKRRTNKLIKKSLDGFVKIIKKI